MQAKLQDMRRLMWLGGSQAPSATRPLGPALALAWPMRRDMERWNSQEADSEGWYGCGLSRFSAGRVVGMSWLEGAMCWLWPRLGLDWGTVVQQQKCMADQQGTFRRL